MIRKTLILCALLAACGDDTETTDGGADATTDVTTKDVAPDNAVKDSATDAPGETASDAGDAGQDAPADAPADAIQDAPVDAPADAPVEASTGCDGGCTKYSFECSNAQPACQCVGLANGEKGPVCDAAPANCFVDPCSTKSVQCVNNVCVVQ